MMRNLKKLLSALLVLCMMSGIFTVAASTFVLPSAAAEEEPEEEVIIGFDSAKFLKTSYANAEDKLRTMSLITETGKFDRFLDPICTYAPYKTYNDMELYVQQETGEVAVKNTKTGQVLFTNPYDAAPKSIDESGRPVTDQRLNAKSKLPEMFSQLIISFVSVKEGKTTTFNTFTDAASHNQIEVTPIKNGVSVDYVMGTVEERHLVPMYMEKYRYETLILENIRKNDPKAYNKMLSMYTRVYMNDESGTPVRPEYRVSVEQKYQALAAYGPEEDRKLFVSDAYDELKEAEYQKLREADDKARIEFDSREHDSSVDPPYYVSYFGIPYTGYMSMYTYGQIGSTPSVREMNMIEGWIRQYDPTYTFDDLEYDHKLTGYIKDNVAVPSFRMALEYTLTDDGFDVRLPANSLLFDEDNFRLQEVMMLPYLGAGSDDNKGYVFVPDGSGSLIRFEDYVGTSVIFNTGTMFGPDNAYHSLPTSFTGHEEIMRLPVYGISETVSSTFEKEEDGSYKEECAHRWVAKEITADCARKIDGGNIVYCAACGETFSEFKPYTHNFSNKRVIQEQDCRHEGIFIGECRDCRNFHETLLGKGYTAAQIKEVYGELMNYTVNEGYGEHNYQTYYVEIDGECYGYDICVTEYELTDENGNIVYLTDENGNYVYKTDDKGKVITKNGEPVPQPVMVQCGALRTVPGTDEVRYVLSEHDYDEEQEVSYEKDGHCYIERTCWKCGHHEVLVDEHKFAGEGVIVSEAGQCSLKNTCLCCGREIYTPAEHTYSEDSVYAPGGELCRETRTCLLCGHEDVNYHAHVASSKSEPVYDAAAHRCYTVCVCQNCGGEYREDVAHEFDDNGVCVHCGYAIPTEAGHVYAESYISDGDRCFRTFVCTDCGKEYGDGSARTAVGHLFTKQTVEDYACRPVSRTYYKCDRCGYIAGLIEVENPNVAAHSFTWTHDEGVNCLDGYEESYKCAVCGEVEQTRHAVGHVYGGEKVLVPGLSEQTCTVCGHIHYTASDPASSSGQPAEDPGQSEAEQPGEQQGEEEKKDERQISVTRGFMAIMTEGSTLASLTAVTGGAESKYCRAYMTVTPRPKDTYNLRDAISTGSDAEWTVVSKRKYTGNYTLNVTMLQTMNDDDAAALDRVNTASPANYVGMSQVYRKYLQDAGVLEKTIPEKNNIPLYLEAFGTIKVASTFLTFPITEKKPLNTFEGIKNVIEELSREGIATSNINVKLKGFTNDGMTETMPYKVDFEDAAGGDDGYRDFLSYASDKGIGVYPDFDFAYSHTNKAFDGYSDSEHAVTTIDGRYIEKKEYDSTLQIFTGTGFLAVSSSVYDYFYNTFAENYGRFENRGVSVATLGTDLNSDFDKEDPYNREDSVRFTKELLKNLKENFGSVMVEGGNEYALGYADHILNMSLTGSTYLRTSCSVPFMSMVLHGYKEYAGRATNMASSIDQEILHIVENGASPYFILATDNTKYLKETNKLSRYYSLEYSTWKEDMVEIYKKLNGILGDIADAEFVDHSFEIGTRVPDEDERISDMRQIIETVKGAITRYKTAIMRRDNAKNLYDRKYTKPLEALETEIRALTAKYSWSTTDIEKESTDIVLSAEDKAALEELLARRSALVELMKVKERKASPTQEEELHFALYNDIKRAADVYAAAEIEFEATMSKNEFFFDVKEEDRLNPEAYSEESYIGVFTEKDGKIRVTADGAIDSEGKPIESIYTINDSSIVRVAYSNGVEIYLNYNYFDVIVNVNGENVRIPAYDLYKTKKGAD